MFKLYVMLGLTTYSLFPPGRIIKSHTDERGLTSVIFVQFNCKTCKMDTFGLDYLTSHELDSLKEVLKH